MEEQDDTETRGPETPLFGLPLPEGRALVGWGTLVISIYVALTVGTGGYDERSVTAVVRWTGRISMLVFLLAYLRGPFASQDARTLPGWAARNYPHQLELLGASHTIHAAAIGAYAYGFAPHFSTLSMVVGGLGYAFVYLLFAMAVSGRLATSAAKETAIETLAIHYVWFVFTATTATSIGRKPEALLFTLLALAAAWYRYAWAKRKVREQLS